MSGVDPLRQFPNSRMAQAVRLGQSRFYSPDTPSQQLGEVNNGSAAAVTTLNPPAANTDNGKAVYAVITAVGGPLYITLDGSVPSAANYGIILAAGASVPFYGNAMSQIKMIGTSYSVVYMS